MKPAHASTGAPEPLENLSIFPREVRDEVYSHVFPRGNIAIYLSSLELPDFYVNLDRSFAYLTGRESLTEVGFSALSSLPKAIRDEAMSYLCSKGTFRFYNCGIASNHQPQNPNVDIDIINRVSKIEILYDVILYQDKDTGFDANMKMRSNDDARALSGPLKSLQGATIARKSVIIGLKIFDGPDRLLCLGREMMISAKMTKSPLLEALKQLTGFKTVTLTLYYETYFRGEADVKKRCVGFEPLFGVLGKALEPTLGNSSAISEPTIENFYSGRLWSGRRYITFHPRDHLTAVTKAKNDTVDVEQSKSIN